VSPQRLQRPPDLLPLAWHTVPDFDTPRLAPSPILKDGERVRQGGGDTRCVYNALRCLCVAYQAGFDSLHCPEAVVSPPSDTLDGGADAEAGQGGHDVEDCGPKQRVKSLRVSSLLVAVRSCRARTRKRL